ncbi:TIGR04104 family putative zinc finger protein [Rummeliibacillus sp. JY-2-4R]
MTICQNCGKKWTWFDSLKKLLVVNTSMKCHHCGEIQYQSSSSRNTISLFILFPIIIIPVSILYDLSLTSVLLLEFALILMVLLVVPLFLKLTNNKEPLW